MSDSTIIRCGSCGSSIPESEAVEVHTAAGVRMWCEDCADERATACEHCGELFYGLDAHLSAVRTEDGSSETWCDSCVRDDATRCAYCDELTSLEHSHENENGDVWCASCVENYGIVCEVCGDVVDSDDIIVVHGQGDDVTYMCEDCAENNAHRCYQCGQWYTGGRIDEYHVIRNSGRRGYEYICDDCICDYNECNECGIMAREGSGYVEYNDRDDCCYCDECSPTHYLQSYHHTQAREFFGDNGNNKLLNGLFLGVELETEDERESDPDELAHAVIDACPSGYVECKRDGSLSDEGCEIVTQPATPSYHIEHDTKIIDACRARGATSHNNGDCGLHVHVNRAYLRTSHDTDNDDGAAAAYIMDRIIQTHPTEWTRFARRTSSQLSRWAKMCQGVGYYDDCATISEKVHKCAGAKCWDRYQAVNTNNYYTVELRLFRGSLNLETYLATIEAATAVAVVSRSLVTIPDVVETMTWPELVTELRAALDLAGIGRGEFDAYLTRRGL